MGHARRSRNRKRARAGRVLYGREDIIDKILKKIKSMKNSIIKNIIKEEYKKLQEEKGRVTLDKKTDEDDVKKFVDKGMDVDLKEVKDQELFNQIASGEAEMRFIKNVGTGVKVKILDKDGKPYIMEITGETYSKLIKASEKRNGLSEETNIDKLDLVLKELKEELVKIDLIYKNNMLKSYVECEFFTQEFTIGLLNNGNAYFSNIVLPKNTSKDSNDSYHIIGELRKLTFNKYKYNRKKEEV